MTTSVIVAGARTPIGKLPGSLKDFSGGGVDPDKVNVNGGAIALILRRA